jgi:hypothetical protein
MGGRMEERTTVRKATCACQWTRKGLSSAYTLTEVTSRDPVGRGLNTKEEIAMAARRTITVVEIVAETLLTLA